MSQPPPIARRAAEQVVARLQTEGHLAYFAGGCVRDELLGLLPSDYDVATDATPDRIRSLFRRTSEVGVAFGVVLVRDMGVIVEVATFRSDGPYSDRRRPDSVTFSDARSDAGRRDFTINALFLDPGAAPDPGAPDTHGRVIDHVGGLADLQARIVRAVGDPAQRLAEDHLRALRAVRFAARLGFEIDAGTLDAVRAHASDLVGVSRERIGEEMRRILAHPSRVRAASLLTQAALDGPVFNEPSRRVDTPVLGSLPPSATFAQALAALAVDRHGPDLPVASVARRWRSALVLSNEEHDALADSLALAQAVRDGWESASVARRKRWASDTHFGVSLVLLSQNPALVGRLTRDVEDLRATPGGLDPEPMLDGDRLIAAGFIPGPGFRDLLDRVYDAQLEGLVCTPEQALQRAAELAGRFGVQRTGEG